MKIDIVSKDLLSLENAVRELHINRATLYRWIARNKVTIIKPGKTPAILRNEVERLQTIGAKRKYERRKPTLSLRAKRSNLLQPFTEEVREAPARLPKVHMPRESPFL